MSEAEQREIKVRFEKTPTYAVVPASGAWLSMTPSGDILCEFYIEASPTPNEIKYEVDESGKIEEKERSFTAWNEKGRGFLRLSQVGVVIPRDAAKALGDLLAEVDLHFPIGDGRTGKRG
jgi:hypothetical protein